MKKLAIVTSHPIQYNAPWFALLTKSGDVLTKVFYTWQQAQDGKKYDPGFKQHIVWDLPLLEGYDFCFVKNTASKPGSHHFQGLINPSLNTEIESWQPDALLVFGWSFQSHLKCLRHFHGRMPVLFRGDSTLLDETGGVKRILRRLFLKWIYWHVDYALYTGSNNKKYFLAHGLKEDQLVYAPHAVDNDRFAEPASNYSERAQSLKATLGILKNDVVLLFAGKFENKKNPFLLAELMRRNADPRLKMVFVGNGALETELKGATAADSRVIFLSFQNQLEMPVIYRLANVFILPSRGPGETWGLALNEAMACGLPVVASGKCGGAVDLIHPNQNGIVIDLHDTLQIDKLINSALQDASFLKLMGERSKEIIKHFSYSNIIKSVITILNKTS